MGWLVLVTVCAGVCGAVEVLAYGLQQSGKVATHVAGQAALHQRHCPAAAGGDVVYTVLDQAATWVLAHGVDAAVPPMALYRQRVALLVHLDSGGVGRVTDRRLVSQDGVGTRGSVGVVGGVVVGAGGGSGREQCGEHRVDRGLDHAGGQPLPAHACAPVVEFSNGRCAVLSNSRPASSAHQPTLAISATRSVSPPGALVHTPAWS